MGVIDFLKSKVSGGQTDDNNSSQKKTDDKKTEKDIDPVKARKQAEKFLGGQMPQITDEMIDMILEEKIPGMPKLGMMQKMAIKGLKKMSPEKRQEVFAQAFGKMGEKGGESKEEMLKQIEEMRANGQLNSKQYKIALKRLEEMFKRKN